jgi:hypothetical protein
VVEGNTLGVCYCHCDVGGRYTGGVGEINSPEAGGGIASALEDWLVVQGDGDCLFGKDCLATRLDKLVDREQVGAVELGEKVSNRGRSWDMWKVYVGNVCGVNGVAVGELDRYRC